jgi:DNA polymerase, archaea type
MARVRFYPLEASYTIVDNKPVIQLFGRAEDGSRICIVDNNFQPYFWVIPKENAQNAARDITRIKVENSTPDRVEIQPKYFLGRKVDAIKVFAKKPEDVPLLREEAKKFGQCLEADILFRRRYLIDKKIEPFALYEAEGQEITARMKAKVYSIAGIEHVSDNTPKLRIMSIDIETYNAKGQMPSPEEDPIIMVAFCEDNFKKVVTWKRFKTDKDYIEFVDSESALIERIKQVIEERQPDILAGYYSDGFDLPYINTRARKYKISLEWGVDYSRLKISKRQDEAEITGITHLDILNFIKRVHRFSLQTPVYDLDSVAKEVLGEGKEKVDIEALFKAWDSSEDLEKFCSYNLKDAELTLGLVNRLLPNIIEITKMIGLSMGDISRMSYSQLVEWYLIRQAQSFDELVPNRPSNIQIEQRRMHTYEGAFVFEPTPGLYKDIVVFDFRSLYPSIISAHNISPDMLDCDCCRDSEKVPGMNHWFCSKRKGFISTVIEDVINRRLRVKEIMKTTKDTMLVARQQALKTVANSIYGYLGFFGARWYSMESAQAITAYGRHHIKQVIDQAKEKGYRVLYSDTDSIFLALEGRKEEEAKAFIQQVNMALPGIMELEYEGYYSSGIFVAARATQTGAKKKYALMAKSGALKIRGFETVRRNLAIIAKETQEKVLRTLLTEMKPDNALAYVKDVIRKLRAKEMETGKVTITTQLQREVGSYDSIGPHVAVAQRMQQMGKSVGPGSMIKYVVTQGSERIRDRAKLPEEISQGEYDAEYYIKNQVLPSVTSIFAVFGINIEEETGRKEQSKLGSFFGV